MLLVFLKYYGKNNVFVILILLYNVISIVFLGNENNSLRVSRKRKRQKHKNKQEKQNSGI